jgi:Bacterial EndoU nuclease
VSPDKGTEDAGIAQSGPETAARYAETRSRAQYYEHLRAADNDPLSKQSQHERPREGVTSEAGWASPALADNPNRPAADSFCIVAERARHILDGDATGGGHRHGTGRPGKTEFPANWTDQKISENVIDVARYPDTAPISQAWNGRWLTRGTRDDVSIAVIVQGDGKIWSAWPLEGSPGVIRNPKKAT